MATHIIDKITDLLGNVFKFKDNSGEESNHKHDERYYTKTNVDERLEEFKNVVWIDSTDTVDGYTSTKNALDSGKLPCTRYDGKIYICISAGAEGEFSGSVNFVSVDDVGAHCLLCNGMASQTGHYCNWVLVDYGFKTKQTAKSDPSASGTTLTAIATITQNANGDITATKKTIQDATTGQKGVMKVGTGLSASSGTVSVSYGTASGTACQGNDSRLSDSRTPKSHNHGASEITSGTLSVARGGTGQTSVANIKAGKDGSGNTITTTYATKSELTTHTSNTSNPHNVTKSQVGLGNVDNTSDTDKPISTATQTALNGKQDSISDIATIRSNATNGQTAYGWGNHANAGYLTEADLSGYETSAHAEATYAKNSAVSAGFNNVGASIYSLGTALDTERDARVASDGSLQGNINSLSQSVSDTNTALNEETAARVDAVSTINATLLNKANTDGNNATGTWPISVAGFRNYDWQTSRTLKIDLGSTTQNYVTIKLQGSMRNDSTGFIYCYPLDLDIKCLHTGTPVEIQALGVTYYANGNPYYVLDVTYKGNVIYISRSSAAAFTAYTRLTLEIGCTLPNNVILTTIDNTEIPSDALSPVNSNKVPTVNSLNALGSTTKPVYVNSNGNVVECDIGGMEVITANGTLDTNITEYFMCSNVTLTVPFANIKTGVAYKIWRYNPAGSDGTPALSITGINTTNKLYYNGSSYRYNKTIGGKASGSLSASTNSPMVIIRNGNNLYVFGY